MAISNTEFAPIQMSPNWQVQQKKQLRDVLDNLDTFTATAAPTALTNSTGATANNTVAAVTAATAAVTDTTAASLTSVNASIDLVNDGLSDCADKINEMRTALIAAGILTA